MTELDIVAITATTGLLGMIVLFYVIPYLRDRQIDIPEVIERASTCHHAPEIPYTPEEAHGVLQKRIDCDTATCHAKYAAFWTVVDAGHATPSSKLVR